MSLTTKSIGKDRLLGAIYLVSGAIVTESEVVWVFLGAGVLVWLLRAPPKKWSGGRLNSTALAVPLAAVGAAATLDWNLLTQIGAFFAYAGSFVFGSGLAIVPFLYSGVVVEHRRLTDRRSWMRSPSR